MRVFHTLSVLSRVSFLPVRVLANNFIMKVYFLPVMVLANLMRVYFLPVRVIIADLMKVYFQNPRHNYNVYPTWGLYHSNWGPLP